LNYNYFIIKTKTKERIISNLHLDNNANEPVVLGKGVKEAEISDYIIDKPFVWHMNLYGDQEDKDSFAQTEDGMIIDSHALNIGTFC